MNSNILFLWFLVCTVLIVGCLKESRSGNEGNPLVSSSRGHFSLWLTDEILNGLVEMEVTDKQLEKIFGIPSAILDGPTGKVHIFNLSLTHPELLAEGQRVGFNAIVVDDVIRSWRAVEYGAGVPDELIKMLKNAQSVSDDK
jgi:hypothetical protein